MCLCVPALVNMTGCKEAVCCYQVYQRLALLLYLSDKFCMGFTTDKGSLSQDRSGSDQAQEGDTGMLS